MATLLSLIKYMQARQSHVSNPTLMLKCNKDNAMQSKLLAQQEKGT